MLIDKAMIEECVASIAKMLQRDDAVVQVCHPPRRDFFIASQDHKVRTSSSCQASGQDFLVLHNVTLKPPNCTYSSVLTLLCVEMA